MSIQDMIKAFQQIKNHETAELNRLMADPSNLNIAIQLTDALLGNLMYLFNFQYVVDGYGKRHEIIKVTQKLEAMIRDEFKSITGTDYQAEIVRRLNSRDRKT